MLRKSFALWIYKYILCEMELTELDSIGPKIRVIRGQRVLLDADLAEIYGVPTKRFNEQVKRNLERFPPDFMFQLTSEEVDNLRSQFATSSLWGGARYRPYVFTEHGAIMAASVLNSPRAVQMSVFVVRAFVAMRSIVLDYREILGKLEDIERRLGTHDQEIQSLFEAIHELMQPPDGPRREIGFHAKIKDTPEGTLRRDRKQNAS